MNDDAAVRRVPQGCFGAGMVYQSSPTQRHRGQAFKHLQSLDGGWMEGYITISKWLSSAEVTPWRRLSRGGSASGLEVMLGVAPQHPHHFGGSLEDI